MFTSLCIFAHSIRFSVFLTPNNKRMMKKPSQNENSFAQSKIYYWSVFSILYYDKHSYARKTKRELKWKNRKEKSKTKKMNSVPQKNRFNLKKWQKKARQEKKLLYGHMGLCLSYVLQHKGVKYIYRNISSKK